MLDGLAGACRASHSGVDERARAGAQTHRIRGRAAAPGVALRVVASPLARGRLDCRAGATLDASERTRPGLLRKRLAALQRQPAAWLWATAAMGLIAYLGLLI